MNYFQRQIDLWGKETQKSLSSKRVAIIGSGGLGCSSAIALSGAGLGKIVLVDFDRVSLHNIHRQIGFDLSDEGKSKSNVLASKLKARCDTTKVIAIDGRFEDFVSSDIDVDIIIDATDNLATRVEIDKYAKSHSIPWVYASVEEYVGQVCFFDSSSFADSMSVSEHEVKGITAPMVMQIASFSTNLALRYLANLKVAKDYLYFFSYDSEGFLDIRKFKMPN
jgi:adenylyltransferase/sulfurtransferase